MSSTPIWVVGQRVRIVGTETIGTVEHIDLNPKVKSSVRVAVAGQEAKCWKPSELERAPAVVAFGKVGP